MTALILLMLTVHFLPGILLSMMTAPGRQALAPLGAKNGATGTVNGYTTKTLLTRYYPEGHENAGDNIPNFYFRTEFDLKSPEDITGIMAEIYYDDGCNVYVNDVRVGSHNTEKVEGDIGYSTLTNGDSIQGNFRITDKLIEPLNLKKTGNVIAVQLFQSDFDAFDILFTMERLTVEYRVSPITE